jgi:phosphatidylglycerophosphate synthase
MSAAHRDQEAALLSKLHLEKRLTDPMTALSAALGRIRVASGGFRLVPCEGLPAKGEGTRRMAEVRKAVVLATSPDSLTVVAGLPLAMRAVLALHAAGVTEVAMAAGEQAPMLTRQLDRRGLGDRVAWLGTPDQAQAWAEADPVLVLAGPLLFDGGVLAPLCEAVRAGERRVIRAVAPSVGLRVVVCPGALVPALLGELDGGRRSLTEALARVGGLDGPAVPLGDGLYAPLDAAHPPAALQAALFADLARRTAAKDSYLAALIDRRLSRPVTALLLRSPITPSQITVISVALGLLGAAGLGTVSYVGRLGGVLALVASIVLDCVDGEVARARFQQSAAGARLDVIGDYVVNFAAFLGLAIGLARQGLPPGGGWAILALVGGVAMAMGTMHRLFVRPALTQGGDLHWAGDGEGFQATRVAAFVEKIASRDYTYLLLVCALLGHLEWFLYAAAVGAWAFVGGVLGYARYIGPAPRREAVSQ